MTNQEALKDDKRNVRNVRAMRTILAQKLEQEETCFKPSDLHFQQYSKGYYIWVNGYEHIRFKMTFEQDEYFGYGVWIYDPSEEDFAVWIDDQNVYDVKTALVHLGYYIATRF